MRRETKGTVASKGDQSVNSKSLEQRFQRALEGLWIAFQPIVSWSEKKVLAYETLVRSDEPGPFATHQ